MSDRSSKLAAMTIFLILEEQSTVNNYHTAETLYQLYKTSKGKSLPKSVEITVDNKINCILDSLQWRKALKCSSLGVNGYIKRQNRFYEISILRLEGKKRKTFDEIESDIIIKFNQFEADAEKNKIKNSKSRPKNL